MPQPSEYRKTIKTILKITLIIKVLFYINRLEALSRFLWERFFNWSISSNAYESSLCYNEKIKLTNSR